MINVNNLIDNNIPIIINILYLNVQTKGLMAMRYNNIN